MDREKLTASSPAAPMPAIPLPSNIIYMVTAPVLMALPMRKNTRDS